ncbi:hypothetical protein ACVWZ3_004058 [Bradyrhizobium sp. i1.3.6]
MRYLILLLTLLTTAARADDAKPFNPADYPPGVQQALRYANEECDSQDGSLVTFAPDTVRKIDLTGDGREDYIVDFRDTKCGERETTYCGTGGCVMNVLVTLPDGSVRPVFDGYVRGYKILPPVDEAWRGAHHSLRSARQLLRRFRCAGLPEGEGHHGDAVCVQAAVGQMRDRRPCYTAFDGDKWAARSGRLVRRPPSKRKPDAAPAHVPPRHESRSHADPECAAAWVASWFRLG